MEPSTKTDILENISLYNSDELADFILKGKVTFDELTEAPYGRKFPIHQRREVEQLLVEKEEEAREYEEQSFEEARERHTIDAYNAYLENYPAGEYRSEAEEAIRIIQTENKTREIWQSEVDKKDCNSIKQYLTDYPDSPFKEEAQALLDELSAYKSREVWLSEVDKRDRNSIKQYLTDYPDSPFKEEARKLYEQLTAYKGKELTKEEKSALIKEHLDNKNIRGIVYEEVYEQERKLKEVLDEHKISTDDILEAIEDNHNILSAQVVKLLVNRGFISYEDLLEVGIPDKFVEYLMRKRDYRFYADWSVDIHSTISETEKGRTEIYMWGVPGSGKSCAIGSIIAEASRMYTMDPIDKGYDYTYLNKLKEHFQASDSVIELIENTNATSYYNLQFDLTKWYSEKKYSIHPISMIDMPGELIKAIYNIQTDDFIDVKDPNDYYFRSSAQDREIVDTMKERLCGENVNKNPRIHIFILEYGGHNSKDNEMSTSTYLEAVAKYLSENEAFKDSTDAICIMVTKADRAKKGENMGEYVKQNYPSFYNKLKGQCMRYEINKGNIIVFPFSIGEVCFQNLCSVNNEYTQQVVDKILIPYVKPEGNNRRRKWFGWLKD